MVRSPVQPVGRGEKSACRRNRCTMDSVTKRRCQKSGVLRTLLTESAESKKEVSLRTNANADEVKVLIDNVLLALKIDASILSVKDIHDHIGKCVSIPESWRSKNDGFEFTECINAVVEKEVMHDLRNASCHTLIVDESTDVSITKMLVLYVKFRPCNATIYKTMFIGILQLSACNSTAITTAIKEFYAANNIDIQKMVMLTSDGASVMLGKNNGVAAQLRRDVSHLLEQHSVAHQEDLGIDDACKDIPLMRDIEALLRTVYGIFARSTLKKQAFVELADIMEHESVAFRALNEVRWLSRHFALQALMRNIPVLIEYCKEQMEKHRDPACKYCYKKLTNTQIRALLIVLDDVVCELAELNKLLQISNLTPIEAAQFVKARTSKLRLQYLGETAHWNEKAREYMQSNPDINMTAILKFIELLCFHLDSRFPDNELTDWNIFGTAALSKVTSFNFGKTEIATLVGKFQHFFDAFDEVDITSAVQKQYCDFRFLMSVKFKSGVMHSFDDVVQFALREKQFEMLSRLLDICATFQASSADCERGFSLMNAIKTKACNQLQSEHLDMLMRIRSYQTSGAQIDLDKVYSEWLLKKDGCEKL
ncbi:zinc finger protein 862-like [Erythrolamprus reginae]|uniref:zinc finger protein 862-like n=1 Tax=Erythrolamprus reginae TaxID=121349 RepID=UPI00396C3AF0